MITLKTRRTQDGLNPYCKVCHIKKNRKTYDANKLKNPDYLSIKNYRYQYGIRTEEEAKQLFESVRKGPCAICGDTVGRFVLDHCHNSLTVRGVLCHNCNRGLGLGKDNIALLRASSSYIASGPLSTLQIERKSWNVHKKNNHKEMFLKIQGPLCPICKDKHGTHINYDHETKYIRGVLCMNCSGMLAQFKDSANSLEAAIEYLTEN